MRGQRKSAHSRVETFYQEWDRIFGAVYGEKLEKAEQAADETAHLYHLPSGVRLKPLLFAIHTYYALLMKLVAYELLALQRDFRVLSFVEGLEAADEKKLRERLSYMESGADFDKMGISNFLEADFFSWYLDTWNPKLAVAVRGMIRALAEFEPATPVLEPDWTRDLLQKLYELIVPKVLRHSLGEYYTPDWLAGYLVDQSGYTGDTAMRFLDPACGSGTFLVQAIQHVAQHAGKQKHAPMRELGEAILHGVVGFDLNPLAVLAARTNYLIAFAKFLPYVRPISIPVYLCDSVVPPDHYVQAGAGTADLFEESTVVFHTQEHDYVFPLAMKDKERIERFCGLVLLGLRGKIEAAAFRKLLTKELPLAEAEQDRLQEIYRHIKQLDDENRDGIWAHYIKNAFAPVYVGQFDYVVGNPPWIRWGYLSGDYRARTLPLWHGYGLFSLKGHETRLGAGEKDFSMLFTYACADRYLKDGGTLAFVITQEVFKSKGAGEGFRRFRIGEKRCDAQSAVDGRHGAPATLPGGQQDNDLRREKGRGDDLPRARGGMVAQKRRGQNSARVDIGQSARRHRAPEARCRAGGCGQARFLLANSQSRGAERIRCPEGYEPVQSASRRTRRALRCFLAQLHRAQARRPDRHREPTRPRQARGQARARRHRTRFGLSGRGGRRPHALRHL